MVVRPLVEPNFTGVFLGSHVLLALDMEVRILDVLDARDILKSVFW